MNKQSIASINKGTNFKIKKFLLNKIQALQLMEFGIVPRITIKLIEKNNFGSVIIKCEGIKYALDNSIAKKLLTQKISS